MSYGRYIRSDDVDVFSIVFFIVVLILSLGGCCYRTIDRNSNTRTVTGIVTEKTVKRSGEEDRYLIFVDVENEDEIQVFEVTDNWIEGKVNSSTIYGNIAVGETYIFTIKGSRNEFLSWYPNISLANKQKKE
jgi:hypothetical protein